MKKVFCVAILLILTACSAAPQESSDIPTATIETQGKQPKAPQTDVKALEIPDGLPVGNVRVPDEFLTRTGQNVELGETVVSSTMQMVDGERIRNSVLVAIDHISPPIDGRERSFALGTVGVPDFGEVIVQKVKLRVREVARYVGTQESSAVWSLGGLISGINNAGDRMIPSYIEDSAYNCTGIDTPFSAYPLESEQTIPICVYMVGDILKNPDIWINNLTINGIGEYADPNPIKIFSPAIQTKNGGE